MRPLKLRTVLVATDLDRSSDVALDTAHRLAKCAGAALHVIHVLVPGDSGKGHAPPPNDPADAVRDGLRRATVSEDDAEVHLIPGPAADTIRSLADRMAADVIVIGPHRQRAHSAHGHPLGGTARAIAARAFAPCLVAAQPLRLPLERVLVPIDLSDTARGALLVALSWASALRVGAASNPGTTLTVLHVDTADEDAGNVGAPTSVDRELERLRRDAGDWAGVTVRGLTERGTDAAQTIIDRALGQQVDLVVLGTRGLGLDDVARLGSVSATVSTRLQLPLLLVPAPVWRAHAARP
jgi:nucleotide-binding universal stress UspA family protein